jgi:hypothetical protein
MAVSLLFFLQPFRQMVSGISCCGVAMRYPPKGLMCWNFIPNWWYWEVTGACGSYSVVEHLPSIHKSLGSIPSTKNVLRWLWGSEWIMSVVINGLWGGGTWWKELGHWKVCLWRVYLTLVPSCLWLFVSWLLWGNQLSSALLFHYDVLPNYQPRNTAKWSCIKTMSQNKFFSF